MSTLTAVARDQGRSLARQGFTIIVLLSTNGGNQTALDVATAELNAEMDGAAAYAPRGDLGPNPGTHSGAWLTAVMLALRPDLVDLGEAGSDLAAELQGADSERGRNHLERFIASIVASVRATDEPQ